jgi:hypothetical protein
MDVAFSSLRFVDARLYYVCALVLYRFHRRLVVCRARLSDVINRNVRSWGFISFGTLYFKKIRPQKKVGITVPPSQLSLVRVARDLIPGFAGPSPQEKGKT